MIDPSSSRQISTFRRELKAVDAGFPKMITKVNKVVAVKAANAGQARARGTTVAKRRGILRRRAKLRGNASMQAAAASTIKPRATNAVAAVAIRPNRAAPFANVAFFGQKRRTGWYAHINSPSGAPQGPTWVGNDWTAGVAGEGPYAINDAIAEITPQIVEEWGKGIDDLTRRAFPGK